MSKLRVLIVGLCLIAWATNVQATILTFDAGTGTTNALIPDSFGDNVAAAATGISIANGTTPNIDLTWSSQANAVYPNTGSGAQRWEFYNDAEWNAAQLNSVYEAFAHNLTFTPAVGFGVLVDSFVVDDYVSFRGGNQLLWELRQDSVSGTVISNGTANTTDGQNLLVNTGMASAYAGPVVLRLIGGDDPDDTLFGLANRSTSGYQGLTDLAIDNISFTQVVIPEPGTMLLAGMAMIGLGLCIRKRK